MGSLFNPGSVQLFTEGRAIKSADEIVNNSNVLQNDDTLSFAVAANSKYHIILVLEVQSASVTPDINTAFTIPVAATWMAFDRLLNNAGSYVDSARQTGTALVIACQVAESQTLISDIYLVTGANAGTFQLQWCQNVATIEDTKVLAGSYLYYRKLV